MLEFLADEGEGGLELGDGLLVLLQFELVVLVLVDQGVEFDLLVLEAGDVLVLVADEAVEPVVLLGHQPDLVLVVVELDLDVAELVEAALELVEPDAAVVGLLLLAPDDAVEPLVLLGHRLAAHLELPHPFLHAPEPVVLLLQLVDHEGQLLDVLDLVVELVLEHLAVLLDQGHLREGVLQLPVLPLPALDLLLPRL